MPDGNPQKSENGAPRLRWRDALIGSAVIAVITVLTVWLVRRSAPIRLREFPALIAGLDIRYLLMALACFFFYVVCTGRGYMVAARAIGVRMRLFRSVQVAAAELYFSSITPGASGGQPAAAYFMARDGIAVSHSTVILLNNSMHYFAATVFLSTLSLALRWRYFITLSSSFHWLFAVGGLLNLILFGICFALIFAPRLVRWICVPAVRLLAACRLIKDPAGLIRRLDGALEEYGRCQRAIRNNPGVQLRVFFWNLLQRVFLFSIAYCVYLSFGYHTLGWLDLLVPQTLSAFAVNALPLPGAAGAAELAFLQLYEHIYAKNDLAPALFLTRGLSFYSVLFFCGAATIAYYLYLTCRKKPSKNR